MTALPDRMRPPCEEGWFAEDLDRLPEAPRHTELIDGALVFMLSPQRSWHGLLVTSLTTTLMATAPAGLEAEREMTIRLDERNRPEPDLLVTTAPYDPDRTWYAPEEVRLVIEVVSPESAHRDRTVKLHKYGFRPDREARLGGACSYVDRSAVADFARRLAASAALVSGTDPHAQKR
jgi:Uma2 family endonuclease